MIANSIGSDLMVLSERNQSNLRRRKKKDRKGRKKNRRISIML